MKKQQIEFEESPFYQAIKLADKKAWLDYFHVLYSERELSHERLSESSQTALLKSVGLDFNNDDVQICLGGANEGWNDLLNGFFRHYYSFVYVEYVMALKALADLISMQFQGAKDHLDQGRKIDNLKKMAELRQIITSLQKELYNNRHGSLGNIVTANTMFKGTIVEKNASERSSRKTPLREAAEDYE